MREIHSASKFLGSAYAVGSELWLQKCGVMEGTQVALRAIDAEFNSLTARRVAAPRSFVKATRQDLDHTDFASRVARRLLTGRAGGTA